MADVAKALTPTHQPVISSPAQARILIASDSIGEAEQLVRLLSEHFRELRTSIDVERAADDFDQFKPHVVVLAFDTIDKAKNYYLGLYRFSSTLPGHPHRTMVLCTKEELRAAFDLCIKRYFDDYILYWPLVQDGLRLPMSIWVACREIMGAPVEPPQRAEWLTHATEVRALEGTLARELSTGANQIGIARDSMVELERSLGRTSDEFSRRLVEGGPETGVEVRDPEALARELEQLKRRQLEQARQVRIERIEPIGAWAQNLQQEIEPSLASARAFADAVRSIRPIVMVVDDDDFSQDLIARALAPHPYQLLFANDGAAAFRELERVRPDAIFMDLRLPGLDGAALTRRLKATSRFAKIPVIMMTADARGKTLVQSMEAGAAAFVVKPFTTESLVAKLEHVLVPRPAGSRSSAASPRS